MPEAFWVSVPSFSWEPCILILSVSALLEKKLWWKEKTFAQSIHESLNQRNAKLGYFISSKQTWAPIVARRLSAGLMIWWSRVWILRPLLFFFPCKLYFKINLVHQGSASLLIKLKYEMETKRKHRIGKSSIEHRKQKADTFLWDGKRGSFEP